MILRHKEEFRFAVGTHEQSVCFIEDHYYTTTAIADYAVRFLQEHAREHAAAPFFLYLAPHSPHFPLHAPAEDVAKYRDRFSDGWDAMRDEGDGGPQ